jgi:hypothetical protein
MARLGYFDVRTVTRLIDEHSSRRHNHEGILWALLCFSTWHRLYVESAAPGRWEADSLLVQPANATGGSAG